MRRTRTTTRGDCVRRGQPVAVLLVRTRDRVPKDAERFHLGELTFTFFRFGIHRLNCWHAEQSSGSDRASSSRRFTLACSIAASRSHGLPLRRRLSRCGAWIAFVWRSQRNFLPCSLPWFPHRGVWHSTHSPTAYRPQWHAGKPERLRTFPIAVPSAPA